MIYTDKSRFNGRPGMVFIFGVTDDVEVWLSTN